MQKNKLMRCGDSIIRILEIRDNVALVVDCIHKSMPKWIQQSELSIYENCTEQELTSATGKTIRDYDSLDMLSRRFVHEYFTLIAGIIPFVVNNEIQL